MLPELMSVEDAYHCRELIEETGQQLCYYSTTGQRYTLHLSRSEKVQCGETYLVVMACENGQLFRQYVPRTDIVFVLAAQDHQK